MRSSSQAFAAIVVSVCLGGCIYEAPLESAATQPVDERFVGEWRQAGDSANKLSIHVFDKTHYSIITSESGGPSKSYRVFTSTVEGLQLANVQYLAPGEPNDAKYAFFSYALEGDRVLVVRMINDKVINPEIKTGAGLRKAILQERQNPALFLQPTTYDRVTQ